MKLLRLNVTTAKISSKSPTIIEVPTTGPDSQSKQDSFVAVITKIIKLL